MKQLRSSGSEGFFYDIVFFLVLTRPPRAGAIREGFLLRRFGMHISRRFCLLIHLYINNCHFQV